MTTIEDARSGRKVGVVRFNSAERVARYRIKNKGRIISAQEKYRKERPLKYLYSHAKRPSIDRIDSTKGYIPGNVWIVSHKANRLKNNATVKELEKLYMNLKKKLEN